MATEAEAFYERASWPIGTPVRHHEDPDRHGVLVRRCARFWIDRDRKQPMVRWHGQVDAQEVPWEQLRSVST